jgi:hypothetical protein
VITLSFLAYLGASSAGFAASAPFATAFIDPPEAHGSSGPLVFKRLNAMGVTAIRTAIPWTAIAPVERPAGFDAADWRDEAYRWSDFDAVIRRLRAEKLEPIVAINIIPAWARQSAGNPASPPRPAEIAAFMRAAAEHYSGQVPGVPRIKYWQVWIEPNVNLWFSPQYDGAGKPVSPEVYRRLVNAIADAVHAARADNVVIAGGLSPFTVRTRGLVTVGPMRFMREMLCMSNGAKPRPTCSRRTRFDVWAHHPYTSGGPTHKAYHPDDVSLGDLPEMRALLDAAVRARHVRSTQRVRFWVTEFSWDTSPPDPKAVPARLHARWVAEALFRMWESGVELVAWLQLRDEPYPANSYQSGLYFRGASLAQDRPKPALAAFRFPFVAFRESDQISVWGRTPTSKAATVYIERKSPGGAWRRVAVLKADRSGIFKSELTLQATPRDYVRARQAGGKFAVPFSLTRPPDRQLRPFG